MNIGKGIGDISKGLMYVAQGKVTAETKDNVVIKSLDKLGIRPAVAEEGTHLTASQKGYNAGLAAGIVITALSVSVPPYF